MQVLVLNVEGRVLTPDQMRAGLFILPSESALASSLLQGGAWMPPLVKQSAAGDEPPGMVSKKNIVPLSIPGVYIWLCSTCLRGFRVCLQSFKACFEGQSSSISTTSITHQQQISA